MRPGQQAGACVHLVYTALFLAVGEVEVLADALAFAPHPWEKVKEEPEQNALGADALLGLRFSLLGAVGLAFGAAAGRLLDQTAERTQAGYDLMLAPRLQVDLPVVRPDLVIETR